MGELHLDIILVDRMRRIQSWSKPRWASSWIQRSF
jgi:hypothetical protein